MQWTLERPSKAGFYWLRNYRIEGDQGVSEKATIVSVYSSFGAPFDVTFTGNDSSFGVSEMAQGEWFGPIEPPA